MNVRSLLPRLRAPRLPDFAPVLGTTHFGHGLALAMAALLCAFASTGAAKPLWVWFDIAGEGGLAVLAAIWLAQLRSSRPAGRVTDLLSVGLAGVLLGQWVDLLDEFWKLPTAVVWDNALESTLNPLGALLLTWGLHHWRAEQRRLSEQLVKRERLFREHRSFDRTTELGDAAYMQAQLATEQRDGRPAAVLMLAVDGFSAVARDEGLAEADRLLRALAQLLLLNLRSGDLLCRYAADRFCVLLPGADAAGGEREAAHLARALGSLAHPCASGRRIQLRGLGVAAALDARAPEAQLLDLARRLAR